MQLAPAFLCLVPVQVINGGALFAAEREIVEDGHEIQGKTVMIRGLDISHYSSLMAPQIAAGLQACACQLQDQPG